MKISVNNASILEHLIHNACSAVRLNWGNRWNARRSSSASSRERKDAIIALQWLVAFGASYLVIAVQDWNPTDPGSALLILVCLLSAVLLQRIPDGLFDTGLIEPGLLILDSLLLVSAMLLREQTPWDLLLLFFFCVFIASIGESLIQIGVASVLLSFVFLLFISPHDVRDSTTISPNLLIRVPFIFAISIFYGYITNQVQEEKKRIEQMEELIRIKRQFASALAHDIKTPLNVIGGHAELLGGEFGAQQDQNQRLLSLNRIRENIDRIVRLLTDFLSVSKLETSSLESVRNLVQMNLIAEDVVIQQMVIAREKQIILSVDLDKELLPIMGDSSQLERALSNLVNNAIKFTPRGGSIIVRSRMVKKDVCVEVTDNGCGIPREELPRLFSEFRRLKGSANTEGTGLGLFIVKTIVDAHNGRIAVETDESAGTTFRILIPAAKDSSTPIPANVPDNGVGIEKLVERVA